MYTLHYFNFYGRGEPIRMLLNHANIEFVDKRYEFSEWPAIKGSFEFGQIPALEVKDTEGNSRVLT